MIFTTTDRQGFNQGLSGIPGSAIQSVYSKPAIGSNALIMENASWKYPLGDPWGWDIYPWNWGKEGEAEKEKPKPDTPTEAQPWKAEAETPAGNVFMLLAVVGGAWFLLNYKKTG